MSSLKDNAPVVVLLALLIGFAVGFIVGQAALSDDDKAAKNAPTTHLPLLV